jgi:HK97 family phage major capsid protein
MIKVPVFKTSADRKAADSWLRAALFDDPREQAASARNGNPVTKAQSEGVNFAGGFLVPDVLAGPIIDLRDRYGLLRQNAFTPPTGGSVASWPRDLGAAQATWIGEGAAASEATASFDNVTATAKKLIVFLRASSEIGEDAPFADWFARSAAKALAQAEDTAGISGDGTSTYAGIRGLAKILIDGSHNAGKITATGHVNYGAIDATDIGALIAALPARALPGAAFYASNIGFGSTMCRLAAANGGLAVINGEPTYGGFPIRVTPTLPTSAGTITGQVAILFGDLAMSTMLTERRGITVALSTQRYMELDQLALRCTERVDIVNHDVGDNLSPGATVALIAG